MFTKGDTTKWCYILQKVTEINNIKIPTNRLNNLLERSVGESLLLRERYNEASLRKNRANNTKI